MKNNITYYLTLYILLLLSSSLWSQIGSDSEVPLGKSKNPFAPIENIKITLMEHKVILDWDYPGFNSGYPQSDDFTTYKLYRDSELIATTTQSWLIDTDLAFGEYEYCIYAVYINGESSAVCVNAVLEEAEDFTLAGTIFANFYPTKDVYAILYRVEENKISKIDETAVSNTGYYDFYHIREGDYLIQAVPNDESEIYENYIPTYYGDRSYWEHADTIHLHSNIFEAEVFLAPKIGYSTGIGNISGKVYKTESSINKFIGLETVKVILYDNMYEIISFSYTDMNGNYEFDDISIGVYGIRIDIPSVPSPINMIQLTEEEPNVSLDFALDGKNLVSIEEKLPLWIQNISTLSPNPVSDKMTLSFSLTENVDLSYSIYNLFGNNIFTTITRTIAGNNQVEIRTQDLNAGFYFLKLKFDKKYTKTMRFLKL